LIHEIEFILKLRIRQTAEVWFKHTNQPYIQHSTAVFPKRGASRSQFRLWHSLKPLGNCQAVILVWALTVVEADLSNRVKHKTKPAQKRHFLPICAG
jgi:hypothetical protein